MFLHADGHGSVSIFDDGRSIVHACIHTFRGHSCVLFHKHEQGPDFFYIFLEGGGYNVSFDGIEFWQFFYIL